MRYQDQQHEETHREVVKSDPVPVPPPDRDEPVDENLDPGSRGETTYDSRTDERVADEALVDRGTFDDPVTVDERADADRSGDGPGARSDASVVDDTRDDSGFSHANRDRDLTDTDRDLTDADRDLTATGPVGAEADPEADDRTEPMPSAGLDRDADGTFDRDLDGGLGSTDATRDADFDRTDAASDAALDRSEYDRDHVAEPASQPTTFGAATVGGAAAAAAMAGQGRAEPHDLRDEDTARRGDGTVDDQLAYADERPGDRDADRTALAGDRDPDADQRALDDRPGPDGVGSLGTVPTDSVGTGVTSADATADGQPVGEVAPSGQLMPGDVPAEPVAALLSAESGQTFRDRWREVQLRFVDEPRAAATDAQRLVEDAIESLTRALAEQKDNLGGWDTGGAGDTEKLRVAVRRYRDFLDRLLGF